MSRPALLIGCLLAAACAGGDATASFVHVDTLPGGIVRTMTSQPMDSGRWSLTVERTIQPAEGDSAELIAASDIAMAADGSILVVERSPAHIKVFAPGGAFVRRIGREGSGPGEFRTAHIAVRGDTLVVQDPRLARAVMFNWRTGDALGSLFTARNYYASIAIDGAGRAVAPSIADMRDSSRLQNRAYVRWALTASAPETLWVTERVPESETQAWLVRDGTRVRMGVPVPLQPAAVFAVDPTADFVTGWSAEYLLRTTRNGRDTATLFGRPFTPAHVTADEKRTLIDQSIASLQAPDGIPESALRSSFDISLIPSTRPAYESFSVDAAGRRWVRRSTSDTTRVMFDLFDRDGRWLDVVSVPARDWPREAWRPVAWGENEAAVPLESEDGRPKILVYRISRR